MNLKGHYLRGALWDGEYIYLVEANRRIFMLSADPSKATIHSVVNAAALFECHVRASKLVKPGPLSKKPVDENVKTYGVQTSRGICLISVRCEKSETNFMLAMEDHLGDPPDNLVKLHDFERTEDV